MFVSVKITSWKFITEYCAWRCLNKMGGIFGIFQRTGKPLELSTIEIFVREMSGWGSASGQPWKDVYVVLGQVQFDDAPQALRSVIPFNDPATGSVFTVTARLDNRAELIGSLHLSSDEYSDSLADSDLIWHAYRRWGTECVRRIYGDWAFAVWQPAERRMLLARDHYGSTALYYYLDPQVFAFATSRRALLALQLDPHKMDEEYLAQALVFWFPDPGERTIHQSVRRLPPAHRLSVTSTNAEIDQYWRLENTPTLLLPRRQDYVEAFSEVFEAAVRSRLRCQADSGIDDQGKKQIGVTLSGGLDSGSVTAVAAKLLRENGHRLAAYTSVPLSDADRFVGARFGNELPYAQAVAHRYENIDLYAITAPELTPVQAVRQYLQISQDPASGAGNAYWLLSIMMAAQDHGQRLLLTGQEGNIGISWTGSVFSQPWAYQIRQLGWRTWSKTIMARSLPWGLLAAVRQSRLETQPWYRASAIHPDFARRIQLLELRRNDLNIRTANTPLEQRRRMISGRGLSGALYAELGMSYGLEILDPTADVRLLEFTFSVPDRIFIEPASGLDRWLIRSAMQDLLPDEVRLNRHRGRQAADLVLRLRASAAEVDSALDELAKGPAAEYVDIEKMQQTWKMVQTEDTVEAFRRSATVLMRGIMAGLCVNEFDRL